MLIPCTGEQIQKDSSYVREPWSMPWEGGGGGVAGGTLPGQLPPSYITLHLIYKKDIILCL